MWKNSNIVCVVWIVSAFVLLLGIAGIAGGAYLVSQVKPYNAKFVSWDCVITHKDPYSVGWRSTSTSCTWDCVWNNMSITAGHCSCSNCGVWIGNDDVPIMKSKEGYSGIILLIIIGLLTICGSISFLASGLKYAAKHKYQSLA